MYHWPRLRNYVQLWARGNLEENEGMKIEGKEEARYVARREGRERVGKDWASLSRLSWISTSNSYTSSEGCKYRTFSSCHAYYKDRILFSSFFCLLSPAECENRYLIVDVGRMTKRPKWEKKDQDSFSAQKARQNSILKAIDIFKTLYSHY